MQLNRPTCVYSASWSVSRRFRRFLRPNYDVSCSKQSTWRCCTLKLLCGLRVNQFPRGRWSRLPIVTARIKVSSCKLRGTLSDAWLICFLLDCVPQFIRFNSVWNAFVTFVLWFNKEVSTVERHQHCCIMKQTSSFLLECDAIDISGVIDIYNHLITLCNYCK